MVILTTAFLIFFIIIDLAQILIRVRCILGNRPIIYNQTELKYSYPIRMGELIILILDSRAFFLKITIGTCWLLMDKWLYFYIVLASLIFYLTASCVAYHWASKLRFMLVNFVRNNSSLYESADYRAKPPLLPSGHSRYEQILNNRIFQMLIKVDPSNDPDLIRADNSHGT